MGIPLTPQARQHIGIVSHFTYGHSGDCVVVSQFVLIGISVKISEIEYLPFCLLSHLEILIRKVSFASFLIGLSVFFLLICRSSFILDTRLFVVTGVTNTSLHSISHCFSEWTHLILL